MKNIAGEAAGAVAETAGLSWTVGAGFREAFLGDFAGGDGVRFSLQRMPTCYRRGTWKLRVEVAHGKGHELWGCFDEQDQPMRWYHELAAALSESDAIAAVLLSDRTKRSPGLGGEGLAIGVSRYDGLSGLLVPMDAAEIRDDSCDLRAGEPDTDYPGDL